LVEHALHGFASVDRTQRIERDLAVAQGFGSEEPSVSTQLVVSSVLVPHLPKRHQHHGVAVEALNPQKQSNSAAHGLSWSTMRI